MSFVDDHRDELEVQSIYETLQFAPSIYYAAKPRLSSARQLRDQAIIPIQVAIRTANRELYGSPRSRSRVPPLVVGSIVSPNRSEPN